MRHYKGFIADSARWEGFVFRDDDIVIATPAKCGTTWMQNIVGMLVFGRTDLGRPITEISPWLDMLTRPLEEVVAMLEAQEHRRFIKTHTPLDGLPVDERVTYVTVLRHPLQVAQSDDDHMRNADVDRMIPLTLGRCRRSQNVRAWSTSVRNDTVPPGLPYSVVSSTH